MKPLSKQTLLLITLGAIIILTIGVFVLQNQPQDSEEPVEVVENQENIENKDSSTLQDLVENSETITLPEIDTSTWSGHYQSEDLGIEFDYPQEEVWFVRDDLFADSVCIGTTKYDYEVFIEGEGDCVVQVSKAIFRGETSVEGIEMKIVEELEKYYGYQNVKLPFFEKNVVFSDENTVFIRENDTFFLVRFSPFTNNQDIKNIFYGVLQTLKPISE